MRKSTAFIFTCALGACALAASAAQAETVAEKTGVNSMMGTAPTTADFVKEAAISDMFEIQSSKLAADKGDAQTQNFATQMVADHTKTSEHLKTLVDDGSVKAVLPTALDANHQKKLDKLAGLSGSDFVKEYREEQVSAHKSAVSLFQRYGAGGDNKTLAAWASQMLPTLQEHLKMAKSANS